LVALLLALLLDCLRPNLNGARQPLAIQARDLVGVGAPGNQGGSRRGGGTGGLVFANRLCPGGQGSDVSFPTGLRSVPDRGGEGCTACLLCWAACSHEAATCPRRLRGCWGRDGDRGRQPGLGACGLALLGPELGREGQGGRCVQNAAVHVGCRGLGLPGLACGLADRPGHGVRAALGIHEDGRAITCRQPQTSRFQRVPQGFGAV